MLECVWSQHLSTNLYRVHLRTNQIRYYASQFSNEEIPDFGNDEICKSVNQKYPESPWKILQLFEIGNSSPAGRNRSTIHTVHVENASQKNKVKPLISRYHTLETQLVEAPKFNVKPKTYSLHIWLWDSLSQSLSSETNDLVFTVFAITDPPSTIPPRYHHILSSQTKHFLFVSNSPKIVSAPE